MVLASRPPRNENVVLFTKPEIAEVLDGLQRRLAFRSQRRRCQQMTESFSYCFFQHSSASGEDHLNQSCVPELMMKNSISIFGISIPLSIMVVAIEYSTIVIIDKAKDYFQFCRFHLPMSDSLSAIRRCHSMPISLDSANWKMRYLQGTPIRYNSFQSWMGVAIHFLVKGMHFV